MINFGYTRVSTPKAAIDAIRKDSSAHWIAGGTNLVDLIKKGVTTPEKLIDINNLPLKEIRKVGSKLYIGALALNSEVAENEFNRCCPWPCRRALRSRSATWPR